jgi:carbonic anhydrase
VYAIYFLMKHTYRAGFVQSKKVRMGTSRHFTIDLALNVSFLNKKRFIDMLDKLPEYSVVEINGSKSVYIDRDILEIFHDFKSKAHQRHIQLTLTRHS